MKSICHLSTRDGGGGAALATYRLHRGIQQHGWKSTMLVAKGPCEDTTVQRVHPQRKSLIRRVISRIPGCRRKPDPTKTFNVTQTTSFEFCSLPKSPYTNLSEYIDPDVDLVQLNWVADLLDWQSFFKQVRWPLVWRLADMNPFTGVCHYSVDCRRFATGCSQCPQLLDPGSGKAAESLRIKHEALAQIPDDQMTVVTQSQWMRELVSESVLRRFKQVTISNGVDKSVYRPLDRMQMRQKLGIETTKPIAMLCGLGKSDRGGVNRLLKEIEHRLGDSIYLLLVGRSTIAKPTFTDSTVTASIPQDQLPMWYSAADVLLFPSLQDNCPNVVLESQACGLPVLAFDGSGTSELIREGVNGWLAPCGDFAEFCTRLETLLSTGDLARVRQRPDEICRSARDYSEMLSDYLALYDTLV
ncbi:glycosyltransferase [Stieleria sp. TO1_6]|uniref:glycosyltransferase n=1 Tax=Stieleria tagensis TaxID=2956795 RepID=UPI00209B4AB3|nr:glycosyltransferase [Stieleria tagensis]MCO8120683.1 glycosyltransferase [Stieleria tagensis]